MNNTRPSNYNTTKANGNTPIPAIRKLVKNPESFFHYRIGCWRDKMSRCVSIDDVNMLLAEFSRDAIKGYREATEALGSDNIKTLNIINSHAMSMVYASGDRINEGYQLSPSWFGSVLYKVLCMEVEYAEGSDENRTNMDLAFQTMSKVLVGWDWNTIKNPKWSRVNSLHSITAVNVRPGEPIPSQEELESPENIESTYQIIIVLEPRKNAIVVGTCLKHIEYGTFWEYQGFDEDSDHPELITLNCEEPSIKGGDNYLEVLVSEDDLRNKYILASTEESAKYIY